MCNIGGVLRTSVSSLDADLAIIIANRIGEMGVSRGKDATGVFVYDGLISGFCEPKVQKYKGRFKPIPLTEYQPYCILINNRATPTTEWFGSRIVDCQPFADTRKEIYSIHNGTIANDKELISTHDLKTQSKIDSSVISPLFAEIGDEIWYELKGSYAVALFNTVNDELILAKNYKPLELWYRNGMYVFSSFIDIELKHFLSSKGFIQYDFEPYTRLKITDKGIVENDIETIISNKALVICSGGLDSTTVAKIACDRHDAENVLMLHFRYGCKAEDPETIAVKKISEYLGCGLEFVDIDWLRKIDKNCSLFGNREIAKGEEGAEYAHEWVAARNTVFIAIAASYCDALNIGSIYLGLNLEEGGAFEDNTVEFYQQFDKVLNLGTKSRPKIVNPLGNKVKHEIVKLAHEIKAPIHLSWSCYHREKFAGEYAHCGDCGPCYMRKMAHKINGLEDDIKYIKNEV